MSEKGSRSRERDILQRLSTSCVAHGVCSETQSSNGKFCEDQQKTSNLLISHLLTSAVIFSAKRSPYAVPAQDQLTKLNEFVGYAASRCMPGEQSLVDHANAVHYTLSAISQAERPRLIRPDAAAVYSKGPQGLQVLQCVKPGVTAVTVILHSILIFSQLLSMARHQSDLASNVSASLSSVLWSSLLSACSLAASEDPGPGLQPELPDLQTAALVQEHSEQNQLVFAIIQSFVPLLEFSVKQDQTSARMCCIGLGHVLVLCKDATSRADVDLIDSGTFGHRQSR